MTWKPKNYQHGHKETIVRRWCVTCQRWIVEGQETWELHERPHKRIKPPPVTRGAS